jgi:hypothetical protein
LSERNRSDHITNHKTRPSNHREVRAEIARFVEEGDPTLTPIADQLYALLDEAELNFLASHLK